MIRIRSLVRSSVFAIRIRIGGVIGCSFRLVIGFITLFGIVIIGFVGFATVAGHAFILVTAISPKSLRSRSLGPDW